MQAAFQLVEGLLRSVYVSVLQSLPDGVEILLPLVDRKSIPARERAALAQSLDGVELLLRTAYVSALQSLAELLQVGTALLIVRSQILINRT